MLLTFLLQTLEVKIGKQTSIDTNTDINNIGDQLKKLKPPAISIITDEAILGAKSFIDKYKDQDSINLKAIKEEDSTKLADFFICFSAMIRIGDNLFKQVERADRGPVWDTSSTRYNITVENPDVYLPWDKNAFISNKGEGDNLVSFLDLQKTWEKFEGLTRTPLPPEPPASA